MDEPKYKRKMKDYEKEGVIYTPTSAANNSKMPESHREPAPTRQVKRKKKKSQFALMMAVLIFTGVTVIIISFGLIFSSLVNSNEYAQTPTALPQSTLPAVNGPIIQESTKTETVAIIRGIESRTLQMYDLENDKSYVMTVDGGTAIKNKYGEALVFSELKVGEIVEISFDNDSDALNSVAYSAKAIDLSKVTNVKIDVQNGSLTVGNEHYYINDMLNVTYENKPHSPQDIKPIDIVTLKGYKSTIWNIEVIKSHGYLRLLNKDQVLNGTLEIDTTSYMALSDSEDFDLLVGTHKIVVKGSNIEPFAIEVDIVEGETTAVDLSDVKFTAGTLIVNCSEPDSTVKIDGVAKAQGEEIPLKFGEYAVEVSKEGFGTYTETIIFDSVNMSMDVTLIKERQVKAVEFTTEPSGAKCYVNNAYYGETPLTVSLDHGIHTVKFSKEGYLETSININVNESTKVPIVLLQASDLFIPSD